MSLIYPLHKKLILLDQYSPCFDNYLIYNSFYIIFYTFQPALLGMDDKNQILWHWVCHRDKIIVLII